MPRRRTRALVLPLCLALWALPSCLVRRRIINRQGGAVTQALLIADPPTLLNRIVQQYQAVHDFSATVDMVPALGSVEKSQVTEYKDVRGYILFREPADIRIIGLYPVVRNKAFDMTSNGTEFRLYVPAKNRFITGRNEVTVLSANKLANLRPQHFLDALRVQPLDPAREKPAFENRTDEDDAFYILHLIHENSDGRLQLARSIWFSRLDLRLARELIFDLAGNILTDARYSEWRSYDGVPFPKHIEINRPQDDYAVVMTIVKMDINKGVSSDKFALEQPEGSVLQVLGEKPAEPLQERKGKSDR